MRGGALPSRDALGPQRPLAACSTLVSRESLPVYSVSMRLNRTLERWRLARVGPPPPPSEALSAFSGEWQCERGAFYGGAVVEIDPDGDGHRDGGRTGMNIPLDASWIGLTQKNTKWSQGFLLLGRHAMQFSGRGVGIVTSPALTLGRLQ